MPIGDGSDQTPRVPAGGTGRATAMVDDGDGDADGLDVLSYHLRERARRRRESPPVERVASWDSAI